MGISAGRIVVGYDGSAAAARAVDWAAAEAVRRDAPLTIVHALEHLAGIPSPAPGASWPGLTQLAVVQVAEEGARRARRTAGTRDATPVTLVAPPAFALVQSSRDAVLMVIGCQSGSPGSSPVALAVSQHAACPVVVVRGDSSAPPGPDRPIIAGVDGSQGSQTALGFAAELAGSTGAPLVIATAFRTGLEQIWAGAVADTLESAGLSAFDTVARRAATAVASAAAAGLQEDHPRLKIRHHVGEGPIVRVLASVAESAGLLVVGSRGLGGFGGLMLGSVGRGMISSAPCPVAVVHGYRAPAQDRSSPDASATRPLAGATS